LKSETPPGMYESAHCCPAAGQAVTAAGNIVFVGTPNTTAEVPLETWTWSQGAWTQKQTNGAPTGRFDGALAPLGNQVVLFGGLEINAPDVLSDTWMLAGTTWTKRSPAVIPPARVYASVAQIDGGKVLLFGGADTQGPPRVRWAIRGYGMAPSGHLSTRRAVRAPAAERPRQRSTDGSFCLEVAGRPVSPLDASSSVSSVRAARKPGSGTRPTGGPSSFRRRPLRPAIKPSPRPSVRA
jgi:hypothetical protein